MSGEKQCVSCSKIPTKYPCKQCKAPTCSLACFKEHQAVCTSKHPGRGLATSTEPVSNTGFSPTIELDDSTKRTPSGAEPTKATLSNTAVESLQTATNSKTTPIDLSAFETLCQTHPELRSRVSELYKVLKYARDPSTSAREAEKIRDDINWEIKRACDAAETMGKGEDGSIVEPSDSGISAFVEAVKERNKQHAQG